MTSQPTTELDTIDRNVYIDLLRFLAITLIILFHLFKYFLPLSVNSITKLWISHGFSGVSLFFVLSGYLQKKVSLSKNIPYLMYLRKRALRIMPIYLMMVLLTISINRSAIDTNFVIGMLFFMVDLEQYRSIDMISHLWFIGILVKFYLIAPFLLISSRNDVKSLWLLMALILILKFILFTGFGPLDFYFTLLGRFDQFVIGILIAKHLDHPKNLITSLIYTTIPLLLFTMLFLQTYPSWFDNFLQMYGLTIEAVLWGIFISGLVKFPSIISISSYTKLIGKMSYAIYMVHFPVIIVLSKLWPLLNNLVPTKSINTWTITASSLLIIYLIGWLTYKSIEQPVIMHFRPKST